MTYEKWSSLPTYGISDTDEAADGATFPDDEGTDDAEGDADVAKFPDDEDTDDADGTADTDEASAAERGVDAEFKSL